MQATLRPRPTAYHDFNRDERARRNLRLAVDALLVILVVAVAYAVMRARYPSQQRNDGGHVGVLGKVDAGARVEKWLTTALPTDARVGADATVARALAGTTGPTVDVLSKDSTEWRADDFIVATPELRTTAAGDQAVSAALASSRPVAVFGRGKARVEVRQIDSDGPGALARRWRHDVADRALAGSNLLRNPRVKIDPAPRAVLRRGGLDMRAVVLLGLLAAKSDVRILALTSDPAEASAGMPARFLRTSIADSGATFATVLAMLPPIYRPSGITVLSAGARQMQWPVAVAPVRSLS